jgi:hypothetical protein
MKVKQERAGQLFETMRTRLAPGIILKLLNEFEYMRRMNLVMLMPISRGGIHCMGSNSKIVNYNLAQRLAKRLNAYEHANLNYKCVFERCTD